MRRLALLVPFAAAGIALAACSTGTIESAAQTSDAPSSTVEPCLADSSAAAGSPACKAANGSAQTSPGTCPWDSTLTYGTDACQYVSEGLDPAPTSAAPTNPPSDTSAPSGSDTNSDTTSDTNAASSVPPQLSNAISAAQNYLSFSPFSKKGLIQQLSSQYGDQYPESVATKAVNSLDVNWNEQAVKSAQNYLSFQPFSKSGLIQQLESPYGDNYTHSQAVYGATQALGH